VTRRSDSSQRRLPWWLLAGSACLLLSAGCTVRVNRYLPPDGGGGPGTDGGGGGLLADDQFRDFHAGTLSESGAKIYVAFDGSLRLLEDNDLDGDGTIDIVFSNDFDGQSHSTNSYIYYGSSGGYSTSNRGLLPTVGSVWNTVRDLDLDGHPEIVFSNYYDGTSFRLDSYIYWGASGGFSQTNRSTFSTRGGWGNSVVDLDHDGHLDLVVSNNYAAGRLRQDSYIFWGSAAGFSAQKRQQVPTLGAIQNCVADLDGDGRLDIVFANHHNDTTFAVSSFIYWGSEDGFTSARRTGLPTQGASGCAVADLNGDGRLDLVFANYDSGASHRIDSYIYWGGAAGFSAARRSGLPTVGARGVSVADLDADRQLDLVFSNYYDGKTYRLDSYIYWGQKGQYPVSRRQSLPTLGSYTNAAVDLNGDGYLDLLFPNRYDETSHRTNSYVYWGSSGGFSASNRLLLPTQGAAATNLSNMGSVSTRSLLHSFTSRVLDSGTAAPGYGTLTWKATIPARTSIKLQLRSAGSAAGLAAARWYGPGSTQDAYVLRTYDSTNPAASSAAINPVHAGQRFIQYRATLSSSFGAGPVLDRVAISLR
jgi:hypothetical protein